MVKIISELEKLGLKMTDEQKEAIKKSIGEEVYSESEHEKKVKKIEAERDGFKERAETAEDTLKGFEGKDLEGITKDRDAWKEKFETLEVELESAINEHVEGLKFKDEYRKRAYIEDLKKEGYQLKDGKLIGASDFQKKYDADAFGDEKQQNLENNRAKFTTKTNQQSDGTALTKEQIMDMKDPSERQKAIREHIDLFKKGE